MAYIQKFNFSAVFLIVAVVSLHQVAVSGRTFKSAKSNNCDCVCGLNERSGRIVGGKQAVRHEFPWIATLSLNGTFYCGGSLITRKHLLTAAHCIYGKSPNDIKVGLGEHNRGMKEATAKTRLRIRKATMHEGFSLVKVQDDIAILELDQPVELSDTIGTACLPPNSNTNYSGLDGVVVGWGRQKESGPTSSVLRKVSLPLLTREECTKFGYGAKKILETNFCAGLAMGRKDACQGDSGGPIHLNKTSPTPHMELIGIVSWGRGCGRPNYPGVYTRVDKYLNWIDRQLGDECRCRSPLI